MTTTWEYDFNTPAYKGKVSFPTGVFIDGKFSAGSAGNTIDVINPTNGKVITKVAEATPDDVNRAVKAARKAFETVWGLNCPGSERGKLLMKLADLLEARQEEFAAIEALDNGKTFSWAKNADLDKAINWAAHGIFWNHGQACCAGSRIFVQSGIYDEFLKRFTEKTSSLRLGDPFEIESYQGPQVSQLQYDRIMSYIESGQEEGATVHIGGERHGEEGYFIKPTIFTDTKPNMRIVQEEIFGPVGVVIKFEDESDVVRQANDTVYGLAAAVFSQDINRAIETAHKLHAGTAWINCVNQLHPQVPFGGYKQSGIGRELGEYALDSYTNIKAVHVNLGHSI